MYPLRVWTRSKGQNSHENYSTNLAPIDLKFISQLACNAVPPLVKLQDLKLKIRRVRCLQMYPLRVRTWCKGQNSHENYSTNHAPIDLKIIPQLACNAVPPLVKLQDLKFKIRRVRCLGMYPLRVRTTSKGQNSHENFSTNLAPIDLKIIPQLACNAVPPLVKLQDSKRN